MNHVWPELAGSLGIVIRQDWRSPGTQKELRASVAGQGTAVSLSAAWKGELLRQKHVFIMMIDEEEVQLDDMDGR